MDFFTEDLLNMLSNACDYSVCMSENGLHEYYETIFNLAVRNNNLYDMLSASLYENKNSLRERWSML